jgi:hypothetical protein
MLSHGFGRCLPRSRPSGQRRIASGGKAAFPICPACDGHALKAVIYCLKTRHLPPAQFPHLRYWIARISQILACAALSFEELVLRIVTFTMLLHDAIL